MESLSVVPIELDWHPFSYCDQIQAPVAIEVDPGRVGDHAARVNQLRSAFLRDVGKVIAIVAQQIAPSRIRPTARRDATPDEEIRSAIAIEIPNPHDGLGGKHCRQRTSITHELAAPLIDVEAILEQRGCRRQRIPSARHIQVWQPIAVRVEEDGTPVLILLVSLPGLPLGRFDEGSVLALNEQPSRDTGRTPMNTSSRPSPLTSATAMGGP